MYIVHEIMVYVHQLQMTKELNNIFENTFLLI